MILVHCMNNIPKNSVFTLDWKTLHIWSVFGSVLPYKCFLYVGSYALQKLNFGIFAMSIRNHIRWH